MAPNDSRQGGMARIPAIARYAVVCVAIGALVAALVVAALGGAGADSRASLPPVREIQLVKAVRASGCELRRARAGEQLLPPIDGPGAPPARPRLYDEAPPVDQLTAALRRGVIVISYRKDTVDAGRLAQLRALRTVVPDGTIVTPDVSGMRYEVAVAAYRRLLGCRRFTDATIDAIRLFRGRYLGTGPER
jgi:hypothetical protein